MPSAPSRRTVPVRRPAGQNNRDSLLGQRGQQWRRTVAAPVAV